MRELGVVRKVLKGNPNLAQRYIGIARLLLGQLKNQLAFNKLPFGVLRRVLPGGVYVEVLTSHGQDILTIDVSHAAGGCVPRPLPLLAGILCLPHSNDHPTGLGSYPEVVIRPLGDDYTVYYRDNSHIPDATQAATYVRRLNNCGELKDWYTDRLNYDNIDWRGPGKLSFTFTGPRSRHFPAVDGLGNEVDDSSARFNYQGKQIDAPRNVLGVAAIGTDYIVMVGLDNDQDIVSIAPYKDALEKPLAEVTWTDIGSYTYATSGDGTYRRHTPWFFNQSGTEAQCIRYSLTGTYEILSRVKLTLTETAGQYQATFTTTVPSQVTTQTSSSQDGSVTVEDCGASSYYYDTSSSADRDESVVCAVDYQGDDETLGYLDTYIQSSLSTNFNVPGGTGDGELTAVYSHTQDYTERLTLRLPNVSSILYEDVVSVSDDFNRQANADGLHSTDYEKTRTLVNAAVLYTDLRADVIAVYRRSETWTWDFSGAGGGTCLGSHVVEGTQTDTHTANTSTVEVRQGSTVVTQSFANSGQASDGTTIDTVCRSYQAPYDKANDDLFEWNHDQSCLLGLQDTWNNGTVNGETPYELPRINQYFYYQGNGGSYEGKSLISVRCEEYYYYIGEPVVNEIQYLNYLTDADVNELTGLPGTDPRYYTIGIL